MTINPQDHKPAANFDEEMRLEPPLAAMTSQGQFRMALYTDEQKKNLLGYLGTTKGNYATAVSKTDALTIEKYQYFAITCYRYGNRYLSVSTFAYAGWYLWNGATGWVLQPNGTFTSDWNGQNLSGGQQPTQGNYLYAWNAYPSLFIQPEAV